MNGDEKRFIKEILENQIADIKDRFDRYEKTTHTTFDGFSKKLDRVCSDTDKNSTHIKLQYGLMFAIVVSIISALLWIVRTNII